MAVLDSNLELNPLLYEEKFHLIHAIFNALQSLTGKFRDLQGNPCNENRDPVMRTGVLCNENRFFPVKKTYREFPVSLTWFGFAVWSCKENTACN